MGPHGSATLTFWHYMEEWEWKGVIDQDYLRVFYKTSAGGTPVLLQEYTSNVNTWTQRTLALPNVNSSYSLIFEAVGNYGYGVCIDDVEVRVKVSLP